MRKYNISVKLFNDIKNWGGCYLKYNKSYMDLAEEAFSTKEFTTLWYWMFGQTTREFSKRNREELYSDPSTPRNGYEHILVVKTNEPRLLEDIFINHIGKYKLDKKEIYKCELKELIDILLACIKDCFRFEKGFEYEICIIDNTRYTDYLKDIFNIKTSMFNHAKKFSNKLNDYKDGVYVRKDNGKKLKYKIYYNSTKATVQYIYPSGVKSEEYSISSFHQKIVQKFISETDMAQNTHNFFNKFNYVG